MDGNTEDLQKFVPQVHFEQIPIKNLCSNQDLWIKRNSCLVYGL